MVHCSMRRKIALEVQQSRLRRGKGLVGDPVFLPITSQIAGHTAAWVMK
jgi:hypothetical protein